MVTIHRSSGYEPDGLPLPQPALQIFYLTGSSLNLLFE